MKIIVTLNIKFDLFAKNITKTHLILIKVASRAFIYKAVEQLQNFISFLFVATNKFLLKRKSFKFMKYYIGNSKGSQTLLMLFEIFVELLRQRNSFKFL